MLPNGLEHATTAVMEDCHPRRLTKGNMQSLAGEQTVLDVLKSMLVRNSLVIDDAAPSGSDFDVDTRSAVTALDPFHHTAIGPRRDLVYVAGPARRAHADFSAVFAVIARLP
jgi:hypothetical protein